MVVLKNFANKDSLIERYGLLEYPKYYLPKDYDYLICDVGILWISKVKKCNDAWRDFA